MNKVTHIEDYLWSQETSNVNIHSLYQDCLVMERILVNQLEDTDHWATDLTYSSFTGREYHQYNLLTFPSMELMGLFKEMKTIIRPRLDPTDHYMIQCWLNIYRNSGYIDWHSHWKADYKAFHGFYCVNTEDTPSYTDYKFKDITDKIIRVNSKDGLLVYGKSERDVHRSSPGWVSQKPRITIAFDIIPVNSLQGQTQFKINHFIPF